MTRMRKIILIILCQISGLAFSGSAKFDGGTPGDFLETASGARSLGMGGSYCAVAEGPGAIIWNPGGLGFPQRADEMSLSRVVLFEGANLNEFSLKHTLRAPFGVGVSIVTFDNGGFEQRDVLNNKTGEFKDSKLATLFGIGFQPAESWTAGLTAKYIKHNFDDIRSSAFDSDLGALVRLGRYRFGVQVQNILGGSLKRDGGKDKLPMGFRAGSAINILEDLLGTIEVYQHTGTSAQVRLGLEYSFLGFAGLRVGWDGANPTFGGSLSWKGVTIDYAALKHEALGVSNRISLRMIYGFAVADKVAQRNEWRQNYIGRKDARRQATVQAKDTEIKRLLQAGDAHFQQGKWRQAIEQWRQALQIEPDSKATVNQEASAKISSAKEEMRKETQGYVNNAIEQRLKKNRIGALKLCLQALDVNPDMAEAVSLKKDIIDELLEEAQKEIAESQFDRAIVNLEAALKAEPSNSTAKSFISKIEMEKEAETAFQAAGNLKKQNMMLKAIESFRAVVQKYPNSIWADEAKKELYELTQGKEGSQTNKPGQGENNRGKSYREEDLFK